MAEVQSAWYTFASSIRVDPLVYTDIKSAFTHLDVFDASRMSVEQKTSTEFIIPHTFDGIYNIKSQVDCRLKLLIDDIVLHDDCRNLILSNAVLTCLLPYNYVKIHSDYPSDITYTGLILAANVKSKIFNTCYTTLSKGTIVKRLQNPEIPIGNYFTDKDADLNRCGISKYYTNKHGFYCEKEILRFVVEKDVTVEDFVALDTIDTWSSTIPERCPGGERIYKIQDLSHLKQLS